MSDVPRFGWVGVYRSHAHRQAALHNKPRRRLRIETCRFVFRVFTCERTSQWAAEHLYLRRVSTFSVYRLGVWLPLFLIK